MVKRAFFSPSVFLFARPMESDQPLFPAVCVASWRLIVSPLT